eukprot:gene29450-36683_t
MQDASRKAQTRQSSKNKKKKKSRRLDAVEKLHQEMSADLERKLVLPLVKAIVSGDFRGVSRELERPDVDVNGRLCYGLAGGKSPLSIAVETGNVEMVKYLVERGANVHQAIYSK